MAWGLVKHTPQQLSPREERISKVQRELYPILTPAERELFKSYIVDWIAGQSPFAQLKANITHAQECHAADIHAGRIGPQAALAPQSALYAQALAVLGLSGNPSAEEIHSAYRRAARELHPDRGGSVEDMQKLNAAFDVLTKRRERWNK